MRADIEQTRTLRPFRLTTGSRPWTSRCPRQRFPPPSKNGWPSSSSPSSASPRSPTSFPPASSLARSASPVPTPPLRMQGLVRMTAVNTFGPLGTEDRFVTSSIPVAGTPEAGKQARTVYTANLSRFSFDMRTPTGVGAMRAFIEGDFAGSGRTLRLRHAYGQWGSFIAGQTWSTFADPEAEPDGIDFEGLNAISLFRQTQVRFTHKFEDGLGLALALENPSPDITGASGISQVPDLIARLRWTPKKKGGPLGLRFYGSGAHLHAAMLFRQLRGEPTSQPNTTLSTFGFGVS